MSAISAQSPRYPRGFRPRRGLNWCFLGLLYTSFYMCRYNLSIANKSISDEYHFSRADMGWIITVSLLTYAFGQIINGLLTDRIGGKKAMLIGAAGTIAMNILFGVASVWATLGLFIAIRGVDGYFQAFGSPGMVKINTAWFAHNERGRFAGIYGFMINLGRFGIFKIGPMLLAGFAISESFKIPPLHWKWLFWIPSGICAVVAIIMAIVVKETPEEAGFAGPHAREAGQEDTGVRANPLVVLKTIAVHPTVWIVALAYACTGAVRQSVDQWFPRFLQEVHHFDFKQPDFPFLAYTIHYNPFTVIGFLIPFVASAGSFLSGYVSDVFFQARRAPVAGFLYFLETAIILTAARFHSASAAMFFLVIISLTVNSTHSIIGTAAAMDIGGRRMAGFASGLIDSFQYFGGSLAGYFLGNLIDNHGWGTYFYFMAPFGVIGGILMIFIGNKVTKEAEQEPPPVAV